MPAFILDRIPLPNLKAYISISVMLLSASIYYAVNATSDPNWKGSVRSDGTPLNLTYVAANATRPIRTHIMEVMSFMVLEPICVGTLVNMGYCGLILIGKSIQQLVFGELRISEQHHLKDKFWNFVFYKFIFVFGVVNVQYMDEVTLWCCWFSVLGFLHLLSQLCKDRFEYLSFSPTTPGWSHARLLGLLSAILVLSGFLFLICIMVGYFGGFNTFMFMLPECLLLSLRTLHVLLRYCLHLYESRQNLLERRGSLAYYSEMVFELAALITDLMHHLHMLLWSNILLSMASLVICMQLRYLFHEIQRRIRKHRNYLWVLNHMEQNYPMATPEELSENSDNCAICWEKMESARKLPCMHLFHNSCLQSWLEQDTSCPTCRLALSIPLQVPEMQTPPTLHVAATREAPTQRRQPNHFFHFDGSRYVSWLPSFSVEVTHVNRLLIRDVNINSSQLDAMAGQVQQLFPHYPIATLIADLQITRSVELTVDNILDGHLTVPARFQMEQDNQMSEQALGDSHTLSNLLNNVQSSSVDSASGNVDISDWIDKELSNEHYEMDMPLADSGEEPSPLGDRFSKSSVERERILHKRKEQLLHQARKRYLDRQLNKKRLADFETELD